MGIGLVPGIILYLFLTVSIIYIFILNDASTSKTNHCLTVSTPRFVLSILRKILGPKLVQKLEQQSKYCLVVVYLVIVLGSWSIMFTYGYSFIAKSNHVSNFHMYSGYGVFILCMWSWRKASTTCPGFITARNISIFDNYPYDDLLFENKNCPTKGIRKLPRSKYDRFTNQHVARFDHFCGWINNAVGEENYRFFLLFLVIHVGMCTYGTALTWRLFCGEVKDKNLLNAIFYNGVTGDEVKADFWVVSHYIFMKHFQLCGVLILMAAMSVVLFLFFSFHVYITANGMTTNEYYKWRQVKKWYKREKKRYEKALEEGKVKDNKSSLNGRKEMKELSDVDVGCVGPIKDNEESASMNKNGRQTEEFEESIINPGPFPVNIYDRGFVENFKEVIFPLSLRATKTKSY